MWLKNHAQSRKPQMPATVLPKLCTSSCLIGLSIASTTRKLISFEHVCVCYVELATLAGHLLIPLFISHSPSGYSVYKRRTSMARAALLVCLISMALRSLLTTVLSSFVSTLPTRSFSSTSTSEAHTILKRFYCKS